MTQSNQDLQIEVPSLLLWSAAKLAQARGNTDVVTAVVTLFSERSSHSDAQLFIQSALSGMPEAIVPFMRDSVDIYATALHVKNIRDGEWIFFDQISQIEAGYFKLTKRDVAYIDAVQPLGDVVELFPVAQVAQTLEVLAGLDAQPVLLTMREDDRSDLQLHTSFTKLLSTDYRADEVVLYAFDFDKVRKHSRKIESCNLGKFVMKGSPEGFTIKIKQAEKLLELHAASLQGYWILIEGSGYQFICPLPDFTLDNEAKAGWLYPSNLLRLLAPKADPVFTIDLDAAKALFGNHRWFGRDDVAQWLEAIAAEDQSP
jgi:hypothetical protein